MHYRVTCPPPSLTHSLTYTHTHSHANACAHMHIHTHACNSTEYNFGCSWTAPLHLVIINLLKQNLFTVATYFSAKFKHKWQNITSSWALISNIMQNKCFNLKYTLSKHRYLLSLLLSKLSQVVTYRTCTSGYPHWILSTTLTLLSDVYHGFHFTSCWVSWLLDFCQKINKYVKNLSTDILPPLYYCQL